MRTYTLENYEGHIAVVSPWDTVWLDPAEEQIVWIFPDKAENYGELANYQYGQHVGENYIEFTNIVSWARIRFLCDNNAQRTTRRRDIPKPGRGGKGWDWLWLEGQWRKRWK